MDFIQPLVIGLMGSFHCIGMCGPIALALPLKERSSATLLSSGLLYNFGRTVSYATLGMLFGTLGLGLHIWGIQQWVSIGMGTLMILGVAWPVVFHGASLEGGTSRLFGGVKKLLGRFFAFRTYRSVLVIGFLNGFLPCGLVYIALAGALVSPDPITGALYMAWFGLGTIPALLAVSLAGNVVGARFRAGARKAGPFLVIVVGVLFVLRGMNLGIPYVSPKMEPQKQQTEQIQKPACCD